MQGDGRILDIEIEGANWAGSSAIVRAGTRKTVYESRKNCADADVELVTILVSAHAADAPLASVVGAVSVDAVVDWGVGGAAFSATVDALPMCILSVPASHVRVTADYSVDPPTAMAPPMQVTAAIAYGSKASSPIGGAKLTRHVRGLSGAIPTIVDIPHGASEVDILCMGASNASLLVELFAPFPSSTPVCRREVMQDAILRLPLPASSATLSLMALGGAIQRATLIWYYPF